MASVVPIAGTLARLHVSTALIAVCLQISLAGGSASLAA